MMMMMMMMVFYGDVEGVLGGGVRWEGRKEGWM